MADILKCCFKYCNKDADVDIISNDKVNEDTQACFRHVGDLISPGVNTVCTLNNEQEVR